MKGMEIISTDKGPAAIGPYSQAIKIPGLLFCSGQIALDPATGEMEQADIVVQTERVMKNIAAVLAEAGVGMNDVVKTTIFLVDMNDFSAVNSIYAKHFGTHKPARSTVAVKSIPRGGLVEIEVIAVI